ncbi:hypothetical protein J3R80_14720 [Aliiroseovarius sp. Z3]|uniref:hypothetical protein n=1 Tax=Aliiroseovarius sp. Z3 TaxID=2811402 RepID=UPI0023B223ED|nr:hypothetical protein [Aliiroseovarius sp. Z3]MDE9451723.1 hypothetical protein [Aliiroseovarius sp. Z3]
MARLFILRKAIVLRIFSENMIIDGSNANPILPKGDNVFRLGTLYKHCKSIHLPAQDTSIRIGTLSEYRINENRAVRDEYEGKFRVSLKFKDRMEVSKTWLNRLTFGTIPFGSKVSQNIVTKVVSGTRTVGMVSSTGQFELQDVFEDRTQIEGCLDILFEGADAWVLSFSRSQDSVINDSSYDSCWSLKPENMSSFLQAITRELWGEVVGGNYISEDTVGPTGLPGFGVPKMRGLRLSMFDDIQDVKYSDKIILPQCEDEDSIRTTHLAIDESAFTKPLHFKNEEETRVIIRPCYSVNVSSPRYLLPNYLRPVLIPARSILDLIS